MPPASAVRSWPCELVPPTQARSHCGRALLEGKQAGQHWQHWMSTGYRAALDIGRLVQQLPPWADGADWSPGGFVAAAGLPPRSKAVACPPDHDECLLPWPCEKIRARPADLLINQTV